MVAITTDGASNFKCALKRHGDDYETFGQLMNTNSFDEELFHLDLNDLENMWCPINELIDENDDIAMANEGQTMNVDADYSNDESFRIGEIPNNVLEQVVDDINGNSVVMLPSRVDCSAHGFNSVGRNDSFDAMQTDELYATRYISVFKKLNKIWKMNSTRLGRETFDAYLNGHKIQKPHRIRWNRIYDAVNSFN